MMPLVPGQIYQLEDVAKFSKFILIKMLELFIESAWGVSDIVGGIRKCLKNYGVFYTKYSKLSVEQKQILTILAQKPGQAILTKEIAGIDNNNMMTQREIATLISTSWLIGGAYKNETAVFVTEEIALLINMIPDYQAYYEAERCSQNLSGETEFNLFDDLTQLTSYILKNPVKITNTGQMSKTAMKKLMPYLSSSANKDWEQRISENNYPFCFYLLTRICEYIDCIEINATEPTGQAQFLKIKEWNSYINMPPDKRFRIALLAYIEMLTELPENVGYLFLEKLLCVGGEEKYQKNFMSPLKLLQNFNRDSMKDKYATGKFGEYYDRLLTIFVLEPLFYFGLAEKIAVTMPTPWRNDKSETFERYLWRLSPMGIILADILKNEKGNFLPKDNRRMNEFRENYVKKILKDNRLFSGAFDSIFPPVASKELVIQNDMTFFAPRNAPPAFIWVLHVFGEVGQSGYVVNGRFTKDSIIKALKTGLGVNTLITFINKESKAEPSPTVLRVIEDWSLGYNRAIFARVTVVMCDTPELADELAANTKLSGAVLGKLGPQTVFIRHEDEKAVRQWLEKKNRVPLPGVYGGEPLADWAREHLE